MAWGRRLEPLVAAAYTEATGRRLRRVSRLLRHRERPWQLASIDREVVGERRLVEIKTTRSPRWDGADPVPADVLAQVEHYLSVTGYDVADVAVLIGGSDLRVIEVGRDDGYIRDLIEIEADFIRRIETRTAPPIDGSEATRRALGRLHPQRQRHGPRRHARDRPPAGRPARGPERAATATDRAATWRTPSAR